MTKLTDEEIEKRRIHITEMMKRRPDLTRNYVNKILGYDLRMLKELESDGVKFGKFKRHNIKLG